MRTENIFLAGFLLSWLFVCTTILSDVIIIWPQMHTSTWAFIVSWLFLFSFGFLVVQTSVAKTPNVTENEGLDELSILKPLIVGFTLASLMGTSLLIFDFAILRGYGFSSGAHSIRIEEVSRLARGESGGSIFSGIGRILTPALGCAWLLAILHFRKLGWVIMSFLLITTLLSFYFSFSFSGGRFDLLNMVLIVFYVFILQQASSGKIVISYKVKLLLSLVFVSAFVFFAYVFIARASHLYVDFVFAYKVALRPHPGEPSPFILVALYEEDYSRFFAALGYYWLYVTQGIAQLDILLNHKGLEHGYGMFQFNQIAHIVDRLFGLDLVYNPFEHLPRVGAYSTLLGGLFVDFGWIGSLIIAPILGMISYYSINAFLLGTNRLWKYFAPLMLTFLTLAPCVSIVSNIWLSFAWLLFGIICVGAFSKGPNTRDDRKEM